MTQSTSTLVAAALCVARVTTAVPAHAATDLAGVVRTAVPLGRAPAAVLADFDGDGDGDVVAAITRAPGVAVLRNDGSTGDASPALPSALTVPRKPGKRGRLAAGDLDGDRLADLVQQSGSGITVLLQREDGGFDDATAGVQGLDGPPHDAAALLLADFDRDGRNTSTSPDGEPPRRGSTSTPPRPSMMRR